MSKSAKCIEPVRWGCYGLLSTMLSPLHLAMSHKNVSAANYKDKRFWDKAGWWSENKNCKRGPIIGKALCQIELSKVSVECPAIRNHSKIEPKCYCHIFLTIFWSVTFLISFIFIFTIFYYFCFRLSLKIWS